MCQARTTAHLKAPPPPKPDPTPTDPAEGWWWMDGWMDGSDSNHVNLWMSVRSEIFKWFSSFSYAEYQTWHISPPIPNTRLLRVQPSSDLTHIQLPLEWQEWVYWSLVFSTGERCGLSFLSQLCWLHSQKNLHLCLYTTGRWKANTECLADSRFLH